MGKRQPTTKEPWHICDNVIDPVAVKLHDLEMSWDRIWGIAPNPHAIESIYHYHGVKSAITWLEKNVSVDFATDFRKTLEDPLLRLRSLCFRALQILDDNKERVQYPAKKQHKAIQDVLDNRIYRLSKDHPDMEDFDPYEDAIYAEISNKYSDLLNSLSEAVHYLRQVSGMLRAKQAKKTMGEQRGRDPHDRTNSDTEAEAKPTTLPESQCTHEGSHACDVLVDSARVAKLLGFENKRSVEPYREVWPTPDMAHRGRAPAKWYYRRLLPKLKEQFPNIKLPDSLD